MGRVLSGVTRRAICHVAQRGLSAVETRRALHDSVCLSPQDKQVPSLQAIFRVRARFRKTGSALARVRRFRQPDWTVEELQLAQGFVGAVKESGWQLRLLQMHLFRRSSRHPVKSLRQISRLVRDVMRCTSKVITVVAAQQDPVKVAHYWQDLSDAGIQPEHIVFYDESGRCEKDLDVDTGWAAEGAQVRARRKLSGKGTRVECLATICSEGLLCVRFMSKGTIQWRNFRRHILRHVLPKMNPWPLLRSVLVCPPEPPHPVYLRVCVCCPRFDLL